MDTRPRNPASNWLALAVGLLLVVTMAAVAVHMIRRPKPSISKVIIGTRDEVYYGRGITMQEATVLGHALQDTGFFGDRGTAVMLARNTGGPVVSFVLNEGAWDRQGTDSTFEEIGRRIATSIGGFPIQVHLVDAEWSVKKSLLVGKAMIGAKDAIYYFGSATEGDARALGQALREAGYLQDLGVSAVVSKGDGTSIGFVVGPGVWERSDAVDAFGHLARRVAASVGGLPVQVRLLNAEMEAKKELRVQ